MTVPMIRRYHRLLLDQPPSPGGHFYKTSPAVRERERATGRVLFACWISRNVVVTVTFVIAQHISWCGGLRLLLFSRQLSTPAWRVTQSCRSPSVRWSRPASSSLLSRISFSMSPHTNAYHPICFFFCMSPQTKKMFWLVRALV